jgi:hypothetical protein
MLRELIQQVLTQQKVILPMVVNLSLQQHNLWTSSRVSGTRDHNLRQSLKTALGYSKKAKVRCMATRKEGNGEQVIGAHILPCCSDEVRLKSLGLKLEDLKSTRNGLFLADGVEKAFDTLKISFVKTNLLQDSLHLKIWDKSCFNTPLWEGCEETIGDFDDAVLNLEKHSPYLRALSYQAYQACIHNVVGKDETPCFYGTPGDYPFCEQLTVLENNFSRDVKNEISSDDDDEDEDDVSGKASSVCENDHFDLSEDESEVQQKLKDI